MKQLNMHQEKLLRLAQSDVEQLLERAKSLPNSRAKSIFVTNIDTAMLWFEKAVADYFGDEPNLFEENKDDNCQRNTA